MMTSRFVTGLNHLGLVVDDIDVARHWFADVLGLEVVGDRGELIFLKAGRDILAIKTPAMAVAKPEHGGESDFLKGGHKAGWQALDHYGFYAETPEQVDEFASYIQTHGATILKGPYTRSDGRSVYFRDPCGLVGEYLYYQF
jgi:catechol 2,3-dioxygenase-like lactoylglutathione lyase family enzyme